METKGTKYTDIQERDIDERIENEVFNSNNNNKNAQKMREKKHNNESAEAIYLCCNSKVRIVFESNRIAVLCALFCCCPFFLVLSVP